MGAVYLGENSHFLVFRHHSLPRAGDGIIIGGVSRMESHLKKLNFNQANSHVSADVSK